MLRNPLFVLALLVLLFLFSVSGLSSPAHAQQKAIPVRCGSIVNAEFTKPNEAIVYSIDVGAGDKFSVAVTPAGDTLQQGISIFGPIGKRVAVSNMIENGSNTFWNSYVKAPRVETPILAARGNYKIIIANSWVTPDGTVENNPKRTGGVGSFTVSFACTLQDDTVIAAGSSSANANSTAPKGNNNTNAVAVPEFGFPGLAPVDFASAATVPLQNVPNEGKLPPTGNVVLGYTLQGKAGNKVDLSFTRVSGNLNLGVVVISSKNKVVFQASLVNSTALATQFTLPADGPYTIGIFRIDLLPPDKPEATSFQIQAQVK